MKITDLFRLSSLLSKDYLFLICCLITSVSSVSCAKCDALVSLSRFTWLVRHLLLFLNVFQTLTIVNCFLWCLYHKHMKTRFLCGFTLIVDIDRTFLIITFIFTLLLFLIPMLLAWLLLLIPMPMPLLLSY